MVRSPRIKVGAIVSSLNSFGNNQKPRTAITRVQKIIDINNSALEYHELGKKI